ncbi:MAG: hypothetical protein ACXVBJ_00420, partial [Flavisolibacter sp.]
ETTTVILRRTVKTLWQKAGDWANKYYGPLKTDPPLLNDVCQLATLVMGGRGLHKESTTRCLEQS